jgi:hypothetical protein
MIGADFIATAILGALKAFWPYIVAAVVALGWGFSQRRAGAKAERTKQAEKETAARDIRDEVQNDIGAMPADKVREELAKRAAK